MGPRKCAALDEIEMANARIHGYGSLNFGRNLASATGAWRSARSRRTTCETVMGFAERILECPWK